MKTFGMFSTTPGTIDMTSLRAEAMRHSVPFAALVAIDIEHNGRCSSDYDDMYVMVEDHTGHKKREAWSHGPYPVDIIKFANRLVEEFEERHRDHHAMKRLIQAERQVMAAEEDTKNDY